jgi:hypothetical protein
MGMISQHPNPHDDIPDNLCPHQHSVLEKCIPVMYPLALLCIVFFLISHIQNKNINLHPSAASS